MALRFSYPRSGCSPRLIWRLLEPQLATTFHANDTFFAWTIAGLSTWLGWTPPLPLLITELVLEREIGSTMNPGLHPTWALMRPSIRGASPSVERGFPDRRRVGRPEMQRRVGPPRSPLLRAREQPPGRRPLPASARHRTQ